MPVVQILSSAGQQASKIFTAQIGEVIRTNPRPIAQYCIKELAPVGEDIATIVESLALADRMQTRRRSGGWSRKLALKIPVFELAVFQRTDVSEALVEAAGFLTGDSWQIEFVGRTDKPLTEQYLSLAVDAPQFVVPYSNGLDSFAQTRLLQAEHGTAAVLPLRAGKLQHGGATDRPLLTVPRRFNAGHPRERTYRTRPLVYFSLAAIGAATIGASTVVIGENGQGALGPSFSRFSDEWPFRSTHPGFIKRLTRFLNLALGTAIKFDQPQLWRTKGEVLRDLRELGLSEGWQQTTSCSIRPNQKDGCSACGFCGGCILRRTALHAAGYADEQDVMFKVAGQGMFYQSGDREVALGRNEREILWRSCLSMEAFASLREQQDSYHAIERQGRDIPDTTIEEVNMNFGSLIDKHANEWLFLIESLPLKAWLRSEFDAL